MSSTRGTALRYAAAWALVVSATAALSWGAISRAGTEASLLGAPAPVGMATPVSASTTGTTTPSPSASQPAAPETSPPTSPPATTSGPRPSTSKPPSPPAQPPRTVVESFTSAGGQVWAFCADGVPRIRSVVATVGWRFEISDEADKVEVKFEPPNGAEHLEVKVRCSGGSPVFSTG